MWGLLVLQLVSSESAHSHRRILHMRLAQNKPLLPPTGDVLVAARDTVGAFPIQHVAPASGFWADTRMDGRREPTDFLPHAALPEVKTIVVGMQKHCMHVRDKHMLLHRSVLLSGPSSCSTEIDCYVKTDRGLKRTWQVSAPNPLPRAMWAEVAANFFQLALPGFKSEPQLALQVNGTSVYALWFKPFSWVVEGTYQKLVGANLTSYPFRLTVPLYVGDRLNGIYGATDVCREESLPQPASPASTEYSQNSAVRSFFCKSALHH